MPDFTNYSVVRNGTVSLPNTPQWKVELKIANSQTGEVTHDFTGANALFFPQILGQLTAAQQDAFVERVVQMLIMWRAGLEP